MSTIDLDELERLAIAGHAYDADKEGTPEALGGQWQSRGSCVVAVDGDLVADLYGSKEFRDHIAAFCPATALELVRRLKRWEARANGSPKDMKGPEYEVERRFRALYLEAPASVVKDIHGVVSSCFAGYSVRLHKALEEQKAVEERYYAQAEQLKDMSQWRDEALRLRAEVKELQEELEVYKFGGRSA